MGQFSRGADQGSESWTVLRKERRGQDSTSRLIFDCSRKDCVKQVLADGLSYSNPADRVAAAELQ